MTPVYVDTGLLAKLYAREPNSAAAAQLIQRYPTPLPFTEWQELELKTALRLKAFRHELDPADLNLALHHLASDVAAGRWQRPLYLHSDVFQRAETLSGGYAKDLGCRSLDILHVAAALTIGAREFLTFDVRQKELARRVELRVNPD